MLEGGTLLTHTRTLRVLAVIGVLAVLGAACSKKSNTGGTNSSGTKKAVKIAYIGALTGDAAALVQPGYQAAQLAFAEANQGKFGNLPVTITLVGEDTQGNPDQAPSVVDKIVSDQSFVGVIGPAFSGESQAAGGRLDQAGLPFVTPSATNPGLATNGWTHWFRAVGNDNSQGPADANYIAKVVKPNCSVVASDSSTYGEGLADIVASTLQSDGVQVTSQKGAVQTGQKEFSALVTAVKSSKCTAMFYGGYSPEGGPLRAQLTQAGLSNVAMVGGDGLYDSTFLSGAGTAGDGTLVSCPCASITNSTDTAAQSFVSAFKAKYNTDPGVYSGEAWDIAQMYISAFKAGKTTRQALTDYFHSLSGFKGLTKSYTFQPSGELVPDAVAIYFYKDENGSWTYQGPATQVIPAS
jgi:branched-chain amino acid transport system substrate-binding protein